MRAQPTETPLNIKGELHSDELIDLHDYLVELAGFDRGIDIHRIEVQFDGVFQIRDVRPGTYTLRVTTLGGTTVHQEVVTVMPQSGPLQVHLPRSKREPSAPGTISVTQLRHPPARKAFDAILSAQRFSEAGQPEKAAEELEKAIRISPEYADAYNNLAVQHMRMGRFDDAIRELEHALDITGPSALQLANLAYAQLHLNRVEESMLSLRAALRLDHGCAQAHLILGSILAFDPSTRAEGITHLERAAETIPSARVTLEKLRRPQ